MGNNQDANGITDEVKNKIAASAEQMQQHASDTKKKGSDETIGSDHHRIQNVISYNRNAKECQQSGTTKLQVQDA